MCQNFEDFNEFCIETKRRHFPMWDSLFWSTRRPMRLCPRRSFSFDVEISNKIWLLWPEVQLRVTDGIYKTQRGFPVYFAVFFWIPPKRNARLFLLERALALGKTRKTKAIYHDSPWVLWNTCSIHDLSRVELRMCHFFERGRCLKGERCNHAHGPEDLREPKSKANGASDLWSGPPEVATPGRFL